MSPQEAYELYNSIADELDGVCKSLDEFIPHTENVLEEYELKGDLHLTAESLRHKAGCITKRFGDYDPKGDNREWLRWAHGVCVGQFTDLLLYLNRTPSYTYKKNYPEGWLVYRLGEVENKAMKVLMKFARAK